MENRNESKPCIMNIGWASSLGLHLTCRREPAEVTGPLFFQAFTDLGVGLKYGKFTLPHIADIYLSVSILTTQFAG